MGSPVIYVCVRVYNIYIHTHMHIHTHTQTSKLRKEILYAVYLTKVYMRYFSFRPVRIILQPHIVTSTLDVCGSNWEFLHALASVAGITDGRRFVWRASVKDCQCIVQSDFAIIKLYTRTKIDNWFVYLDGFGSQRYEMHSAIKNCRLKKTKAHSVVHFLCT